jgi:ligand-binding sensor domain-containing protein
MKYIPVYALFLIVVFCTCYGQKQSEPHKDNSKNTVTSYGPKTISRNIIQDKKGNIWIAAFDGIFCYDGKHFANITSKVSSARFFSVLEDKKGNFWFGSIGSGVYYYDRKSFKNFTTREGLLNNEVTSIYEDKKGNVWFGVSGGASSYNGKSFRNYIIDGNAMNEDWTGKIFENRRPYEVTSIIEDKTGKFWFATRGGTFVYNGKAFSIVMHGDKSFKNVRSLIKDKRGNIWLGGADGLWRYNGSTFTNFTRKFVGHIIEDKEGNIWTSSERDNSQDWTNLEKNNRQGWALSRYNGRSLSDKKPTVTEITHKPMIFGILEAIDGTIWFGAFDGVHRYNGSNITSFNSKAAQK